MKSIIEKTSALLICLALLVSFPLSTAAVSIDSEATAVRPQLTQNQINIAARGDYMYGLTWVCQKTVSIHSYSWYHTFYAGETHRMPYGQGSTSYYIGYGVTPENFLKAAADVNSIFYTQKSYAGSWYSTYYIQDCSGFVSWCWGLTAKQSTRSLANVSSYVASITTNNIKNYLQVGDALNRYDYHVVLVTDITYDSAGNMTAIEITEQTWPETKRTVYTPASLASTYSSYDGIYRYYGTVPAAPSGGVTTTHKLEGHAAVDMGQDFYARIKHPASNKYVADLGGTVYATDLSGGSEQVWHFMRQSSGAYLVGNVSTSKFLEVQDASYKDGTPLVTNSVDYESNQKFYIYCIDTNFHFMPEGGDKTVDVASGTLITQIYGNTRGGTNQVAVDARTFNLEIISTYEGNRTPANLGDNFQATIKNSASGKYLTASGSTLIGADKSKEDNQKWNFTRLPNGAYTISSQSENLVIDVYETRLAEGTTVDLFTLHGGNAQTFFLIEKDGKYYIKSTYSLNALYMDATNLDFYTYTTGDSAEKLAAQLYEIKLTNAEEELVIKENSNYSKDEGSLVGVKSGQNATELLANFDNEKAIVVDIKGAEVSATAVLGTGFAIVLVVDDEKIETLEIVIKGDVTGDGVTTSADLIAIRNSLKGQNVFAGAFLKAADINADKTMSTLDYVQMASDIKN